MSKLCCRYAAAVLPVEAVYSRAHAAPWTRAEIWLGIYLDSEPEERRAITLLPLHRLFLGSIVLPRLVVCIPPRVLPTVIDCHGCADSS